MQVIWTASEVSRIQYGRDPPYFATENYYKDVGFKTKDHIRLRDSLMDIKGKFLVSYNDCPEIREIWDKPNIHIEEISRLNNLAQRYDGGCQYAELLISITIQARITGGSPAFAV